MADASAAAGVGFSGSVPELYDRHLGPLLFAPYAADLASRAARTRPRRILELACGTGILTRELIRSLPADADITASDLSEGMLAVAKSRIDDDRVRWRQADALALPFDAATFDLIVCQFGVMFFPDKPAAAAQVRRVLRPGGTYLFNVWGALGDNPLAAVAQRALEETLPQDTPTFYHVPWGYCDPATIDRDARRGGFDDVKVEPVDVTGRSESAEHAAIGVTRGSPIAVLLAERGAAAADEVTKRTAEAFAREFGRGPIGVPMRAYVVTCR
jgi:SAM-dependent methyltransferase